MAVKAKSGKAKSKPIGRYSHRTAWLNKVLFQEGFCTMEVEPMMRSHLMLKVCVGSVNSNINL